MPADVNESAPFFEVALPLTGGALACDGRIAAGQGAGGGASALWVYGVFKRSCVENLYIGLRV
ncbi:MAG: hypothetical protein Q8O41_06920 [Candidatus Methanoperedens sp.]|nr:hypothetical protein [Candidatus Methanoperedens sp.]